MSSRYSDDSRSYDSRYDDDDYDSEDSRNQEERQKQVLGYKPTAAPPKLDVSSERRKVQGCGTC